MMLRQNVLVARAALCALNKRDEIITCRESISVYADVLTNYVYNKCIGNCGRLWMDYGTTVTNFLNYFVTLYL